MAPKKGKAGKKASKRSRAKQHNELQQSSVPQQQQERLQHNELPQHLVPQPPQECRQEQEQAHAQAEHEKEAKPLPQRSSKKWSRLVMGIHEQRQQQRQAASADSDDSRIRPKASHSQQALDEADDNAMAPRSTDGAADKSKSIPPSDATDDFVHSEDPRLAGNITTYSDTRNLPRHSGGEPRAWKPDSELLRVLKSANDQREADKVLHKFLHKNSEFAPIIQRTSLDRQTPPDFFEQLLPLVDRTQTQCFSELPAQCRRFLKEFIGSATFSDGICRPATLRSLSTNALRHLVAVLQLAIQELPSEQVSDNGGYFAFPIDTLQELVYNLDSHLRAEVQRLETHLCEEREFEDARIKALQHLRTSGAYDEAGQPTDYQHVNLLPTDEELKIGRLPDLVSNQLDGVYANSQEYIETHFRLLREDFVGPLRSAVQEYVLRSLKGETFRRLDAGSRLYRNVILLRELGTNTFRFKMPIQGRALDNWENGKALACGSLILLSRDDFWTITYATVEEKCRASDGSAVLEVRLLTGHRQILQVLFSSPDDSSRSFALIESESYYEAYRHNAAILQRMSPNSMPFRKYLVERTSAIDAPSYLLSQGKRASQSGRYDFSTVFGPAQRTNATVNVLDNTQWPKAVALNLDESQADALKFSLTKEFAIIQGPPGTGKTYVGTKIVDVLLANEKAWTKTTVTPAPQKPNAHSRASYINSSMFEGQNVVIICYTNHALDQFLEHIVRKYPGKVARVGGNSGNAVLDQYNIKELMKKEQLVRSPEYKIVKGGIEKLEREIKILSKETYENLTWTEAAPLMNSTQAKQIGSDERWQRWVTCTDLSQSTSSNYAECFRHAEKSPLRMSFDEFNAVDDMWKLDLVRRRRMLNRLKYARELDYECKISERIRTVAQLKDTLHELRMQEFLPVFKGRPIVGMTVTGAAKYSALIRLLKPSIVIVEEAAEVLEAHILTSLTESCQHLILIGDHQQLRPNPCMYELVQSHNLDVSLFERMVKHNQLPFVCLKVQRRMRPEISKIITPIIYKELLDHACVEGRPHVKGLLKNVFFVNHRELEGSDDSDMRSHVNYHEAGMVVALCGHLLQHAYEPKQITVLVAYSGQLLECKRRLRQYQRPELGCDQIRVTTVDNYQGEENDIIVLSLVRSNERGSVGFLSTDNRICVALSRARLGFYCFGNFELLSRRSNTWSSIAALLSRTNEIGDSLPLACHKHPDQQLCVSKPADFENSTNGHGCTNLCNERLSCGHSCSDPCHYDDVSHTSQHRCRKRCMKLCAAGKHNGSCKMLCYQTCQFQPCQEGVPRTFKDCGHTGIFKCSVSENDVYCIELVSTTLACTHEALITCHQSKCTAINCQKKCRVKTSDKTVHGLCGQFRDAPLCHRMELKTYEPCGHQVQVSCHALHCLQAALGACALSVIIFDQEEIAMTCQDFARRQCQSLVQRTLACGHSVTAICSDRSEVQCTAMINATLPLCGHKKAVRCCDDLETLTCLEVVTKKLPCGHDVKEYCFKDIVDIYCNFVVEKILACGHNVLSLCSADPHCLPCTAQATERLPCGHDYTYICSTRNQEDFICNKMTKKELPCSHSKLMLCSQDVNRQQCDVLVIKKLPCGHQALMQCSQDTRMLQCWELSEKELPCGHKLNMPCFEEVRNQKCKVLVTKQLKCGHKASMPCFEEIGDQLCQQEVETTLSCDHVMKVLCGLQPESYPQCMQVVYKKLHCGHEEMLPCSQGIRNYTCNKTVSSQLTCGHSLSVPCSESNCSKDCLEMVTKKLACGHDASMICSKDPETYKCQEIVERQLPCEHVKQIKCSLRAANDDACDLPVSRPLPCGHVHVLPCRTDVSIFTCEQKVEKTLPCGHNMTMMCHQTIEQFQCREMVTRLLPCEHHASMMCSEDIRQHRCLQQTTKTLPCGHDVSALCFHDALSVQCTAIIKKELPCGHRKSVICGQEVGECVSEEMVEKQLPCKHLMKLPCSTPTTRVQCKQYTNKPLPCGHEVQTQCYKDVGSRHCLELVDWKLPCGHSRRASCHLTRCAANGCRTDVQLQVDSDTKSANSVVMGACELFKNLKCTVLISVKLPCGHSAKLRCCEKASAGQYPCPAVVERRFDCGHSQSTTCHVTVCRTPWCPVNVGSANGAAIQCGQAQKQLAACSHLTSYALSCGHATAGDVPCHVTQCTNATCLLQLTYSRQHFECRALRQVLTNCSAPVFVQLACGHNRAVTCQQSRLCTCTPAAACGEGNLNGGLLHRQHRAMQQSLPLETSATDKALTTQCSLHAPCGELVDKALECGHHATVACRDSLAPIACAERTPVVVPTCGHAKQSACASRRQSSALLCEEELCSLACSHGGCARRCSEPCQPCARPCEAGCQHSARCDLPCFRPCDVPPCDKPCGRVLSCGHPCLGLCGERCPEACVACPKGSHRQELLRHVCAKFAVSPSSKFLRLQPCGHDVPLEIMDRAVKQYEESVQLRFADHGRLIISYRVRPLQCPACRQPVGGCRRYDKVLKRYFNMKRKLPANVTGEWLGCLKGHVWSAEEPSCRKCNSSIGRQTILPVGLEVEVTSGTHKGLVGVVVDIGVGEAVVAAGSHRVVVDTDQLRVTQVRSLVAS